MLMLYQHICIVFWADAGSSDNVFAINSESYKIQKLYKREQKTYVEFSQHNKIDGSHYELSNIINPSS